MTIPLLHCRFDFQETVKVTWNKNLYLTVSKIILLPNGELEYLLIDEVGKSHIVDDWNIVKLTEQPY
jgi:hypothetical protein